MDNTPVAIEQSLRTALDHHRAGRLGEAEAIYRQVLALQPTHAAALHHLGLVALQMGRPDVAFELLTQSLRSNPQDAVAHFNLAESLLNLDRLSEAVPAYERALALRPGYAKAHDKLGYTLSRLGQWREAADHYEKVLALYPDHFDAHNNLSVAWRRLAETAHAIASGERAVALQPGSHEAHNNLAGALQEGGWLDRAAACYEQAIALAPDVPSIHSNLILSLHYHSDTTPQRLEEEHRRWNARHAQPLRPGWRAHGNDPDPARRLKVGYVSPDFRQHAVSSFLIPLLEAHTWKEVKAHCFASVARPDALTKRYKRGAGVWHDVHGLPDADLAERIREEKIDILVDLSMHTAHNRLPLFARRPAPVQVAWLAYAGTSGLTGMDYRLTDAHMEPPGHDAEQSAEERVRLPDSWCCYHPLDQKEPVDGLPALRAGAGVTFGSLNNFAKVNDGTLRDWARVLREVHGSRLLMNCPPGAGAERVLARLAGEGIEAGRVEFVSRMTRDPYFQTYQRIDIALDPSPFNGMTTTCDALWMGVPVLSMYGELPCSRTGLSLLTTVGLPELAVPSADALVQAAVGLAGDLPRLAQLRAGLRARMKASPLMDAPRFARHVEAVYRMMWRRWCEGAGRAKI